MPQAQTVRAAVVSRERLPAEGLVIDTAYLSGPAELHIRFSMAHACPGAQFDLVHTGMVAKSLPPQLPIFLSLRGSASPGCTGEPQAFDRKFDLSPLLGTGGPQGIVLNLRGWRGRIYVRPPSPKIP